MSAAEPAESTPAVSGAKVTGRIINLEGSPIAKVTVTTDPPTATAMTGAEGTFSLGLPEGSYTLVFVDSTGEMVETDVEVSGDVELGDVKLDAMGAAAAEAMPDGEGEARPVQRGGRD